MTLLCRIRRTLGRWLARLTAWPPCPRCGVEHDPRVHYPLHDDAYGD